jgi:DNA-binding NarL/FixJ family response regulator
MNQKKLVLIEDSPLDLTLAIDYLIKTGDYEIAHTFLNGSDFLNHLENNPVDFDVVIIDYRMPVLNGMETMRNLLAKKSKFKMLLVSHGYYSHVMEDLISMGTQNYCRKTQDQILRALPILLEGRPIYPNNNLIESWDMATKSTALQMRDEKNWRKVLSPVHMKMIRFMSAGLSSKEIAPLLGYETSSIEKYRGLLLKEFDLSNTQQLIAFAYSEGIVNSTVIFQVLNEVNIAKTQVKKLDSLQAHFKSKMKSNMKITSKKKS